MSKYVYKLIDANTKEEVSASDGFSFDGVPTPEHRIHDAALMERYGGPAIVDRVDEVRMGELTVVKVYIDGVEERMSGQDADENYRRS